MTRMIAGIDHFVLTVADLPATLDFYERVLGLERHVAADKPAALMMAGQKINVHQRDRTFEPKADRPTPGAGDFCLVADVPLEQVVARIEANGVAIECGPVSRTGARGAMTSVYLRDPDRNLVEISRYDADA